MLLFTLAILDDQLIPGVHMFTYFSVLFSLLFENFIYTHNMGSTFFSGTHFSKCLTSHQDRQEQRTETHPNPPPYTDHFSGKLINQKHKPTSSAWETPLGHLKSWKRTILYTGPFEWPWKRVLGKYPDAEKAPSAHWLEAKTQYQVNSKGLGYSACPVMQKWSLHGFLYTILLVQL